MSFISLFRHQKRFLNYKVVYKGPFDYKRDHTKAYKYPFGINKSAIEEEMNQINELRQHELKQVSPFHLVWRHKDIYDMAWHERYVLSHLGLHQKEPNLRVVLPNTPHFNDLLWKVKHLIQLMPIAFPDGVPTDRDVGSVKLNTNTGVMNVNPNYKVSNERLDSAKSHDIFYGRYLREYLKWSSGLFGKSLPVSPVIDLDGTHIEKYKRKMQNAHKHRHHFYNN
ncbi:unnamed protein product [Medioppia subpectinata]|uniref:Large ribosomal subunit protein uL30m n=1 Tax=Medioppia subpectinata TaxID=1979941 RepID=A0A7R9KYS8_9ACAR|nr:unnamed protein product [Medioppia subpectinata]CAG2112386.1 unnamed protein product [Medioppia subpectinata]